MHYDLLQVILIYIFQENLTDIGEVIWWPQCISHEKYDRWTVWIYRETEHIQNKIKQKKPKKTEHISWDILHIPWNMLRSIMGILILPDETHPFNSRAPSQYKMVLSSMGFPL